MLQRLKHHIWVSPLLTVIPISWPCKISPLRMASSPKSMQRRWENNYLFNTILCLYFPDHPSLTWYSQFQNFHHQHHGLPAFCVIQKKELLLFSILLSFGYRPRPKHALETFWALTILFYRGFLSFCHSTLAYMLLRYSGHWQSFSIVAPSSSAIPHWPVLLAVPLLKLPAFPPPYPSSSQLPELHLPSPTFFLTLKIFVQIHF